MSVQIEDFFSASLQEILTLLRFPTDAGYICRLEGCFIATKRRNEILSFGLLEPQMAVFEL